MTEKGMCSNCAFHMFILLPSDAEMTSV